MELIESRGGLLIQRTNTFPHVRAALKQYEIEEEGLNKLLDDARTLEELKDWESARQKALNKVWLAFQQDTDSINPIGRCLSLPPDTLRMFVNIGEAIERGALPAKPSSRVSPRL